MKTIASIAKDLGDSGSASASLVIDQAVLKAQVAVEAHFPLDKILTPVTSAVDGLLDKVKAAIPGSWDDAIVDGLKKEFQADLVKALSEQ